MRSLIFLGVLLLLMVNTGNAYDMGLPTSGSDVSYGSSGGLIGKTVHVITFKDDYNIHIVTKITDVELGMLKTSDWYYSASRDWTGGDWRHLPGTHWVSIAQINGMWEEALPVTPEGETPAQPGMTSVMALLGLLAVAYIVERRN